MDQQNRDCLVISQAEGIGPATFQSLIKQFGSPKSILSADIKTLKRTGLEDKSIKSIFDPDEAKIARWLEWINLPSHHLVTILDDDYPPMLKSISSAPPVLFAIGQRQVLQHVQFSIIGSRNPTQSGRKLTEEFAGELCKAGFSICSGLALGIDYHSHVGALDANGVTIAVLGNGLSTIYPARHRKIAEQIVENGLLLSEYVPETKPAPGNFPRRNRIISGLSIGVLVVEAAQKSGSLITANYALEQNREVFAIPGSIHSPLSKGTHSLIKQGAKLTETTKDILEEIGTLVQFDLEQKNYNVPDNSEIKVLDSDYQLLLDKIGYNPMTIDELVKSSGLTAEAVSSMLLILELKGMVESRHGGKYCRCA